MGFRWEGHGCLEEQEEKHIRLADNLADEAFSDGMEARQVQVQRRALVSHVPDDAATPTAICAGYKKRPSRHGHELCS